MALSSDLIFSIFSTCLCATLILFRCVYRAVSRCHIHKTCHRHWRNDDTIMAFALLPLIGRSATILSAFVLNPPQSTAPVSVEEANAVGLTVAQLNADRELARKLLIPGRICYALFLWCLKLCLLAFYSRFINTLDWGKRAATISWWFIVVTFVGVVIATVSECRPLHLFVHPRSWGHQKLTNVFNSAWDLAPPGKLPTCAKAMANLLTMAITNILTDLVLIALPFPMLRNVRLQKKDKLQLYLLFGIGTIVVIITLLRLPLILTQSLSQRTRSLWASIEILCACIVANAAFFFTLSRDIQRRHTSHSQGSNIPPPEPVLYLRRISTSSATGEVHFSSSKASSNGEDRVTALDDLYNDETRIIGRQ
ncbi:uncharacterized protein F5Z01DRAFT_677286 [Emericellopsis atlantica]|uniref:Rhodopsin domain-containing protein n=1 Tax=Emericellopsis atlantica TaxID=2614577 RepID=A0A9P8CLG1_9HYPO|nr:uncharacterized protein F5Z01DRAFT_677286 [Emericellopsis atlantica]KAG9251037.1 hypothetical protein F5Z01DRAFT_677286 [Emericellopsis atlantica]